MAAAAPAPELRIILPDAAPVPHDRFAWVGDSVAYWAGEAATRLAVTQASYRNASKPVPRLSFRIGRVLPHSSSFGASA